jgi:hypothetical protein
MTTDRTTAEHVHEWMPVGIAPEDQVSYSPVSAMDHQVRTNQIAVTSCACGEFRRALVSSSQWRWLNRRNPDD